jgi:sugar-specific transcriptional regulator TrmB
MIMDKNTLARLRRYFSLNLYEVKIWTALLSRGISTAGELSDIAEVPRSRAYDILESLEKKGFVVMKLGKPIKYIAVPPEEVVDRVKKFMHADAEEKSKRLDTLKSTDMMKNLNTLFSQGIEYIDPTELTGAIRGRQNLYNHMETMIKGAKKDVVIVTSGEGLVRKTNALKNSLKSAKDRGVRVRVVAKLDKDQKKLLKDFKGLAEIKDISDIEARFAVVDGEQALLMLKGDTEVHPNYDSAVWMNSKMFASALNNMFDRIWKGK